ncbi:hypothetical protein CCR75_009605 [Bremia lactucae]|uniref:Uncharacterized protein n=1 Tax=Bremia lactucae TaxID=4779 RepID=A0A976FH43_BRELC|nr:hypothetical protein CCR75_009605 [Bremia lactucae]
MPELIPCSTALQLELSLSDYQSLNNNDTAVTEGSRSSFLKSTLQPFQMVTSLQARVQGDMPQWDTDKQRFVSDYYATFDKKYRALLDTVNMAAVEGALKFVQAECINASVVTDCKRKNNIEFVVFYQTSVVQPTAAMNYYANVTDEYGFTIEHCPLIPMDGGQCHIKADGSFAEVCSQYIGINGQPKLGFCVGGSLQDNELLAPYPHNYWFSFQIAVH